MQGDSEKALQSGMDDYVPKPVKPEEIEAALGRWVAPEEGASATAADGEEEISTANSEEAESTPLDEGVIENLLDLGGSEMLAELSEMFLEDAGSGLVVLRKAAEEGDAPSVERAAHTLKGASGNMGALGMARTCAQLEEAGGSGDLSCALTLLARLDAEFGRVRQALPAVKS
jgi:HPt (histidine-containing phosphotransfer) domain-containing protein